MPTGWLLSALFIRNRSPATHFRPIRPPFPHSQLGLLAACWTNLKHWMNGYRSGLCSPVNDYISST